MTDGPQINILLVQDDQEKDPKLAVVECYGPVPQGEGKNLGRPVFFLRLGGCNLRCKWCDTPYTWDWTGVNGQAYTPRDEISFLRVSEVRQQLSDKFAAYPYVRSVVLSGGEPMLQHRALTVLLRDLYANSIHVEVETNGTINPSFSTQFVSQWNVSPKLQGVNPKEYDERYPVDYAFWMFTGHVSFKFVVGLENIIGDVSEIDSLRALHKIPRELIYVMPEGRTAEEIRVASQKLIPIVMEEGYNFTTRMHISVYGQERGR